MRVNMDSSITSDPRFKLVAAALGVNWREVIGSCFLLWTACYERRSKCLRKVEADVAAELQGFADALIAEGLATDNGDGTVIVHGVEKRIAFLEKQKEKGAKGGKAKGKKAKQTSKPDGSKCLAPAKADAIGSAQAYSPAPAPAPAPVEIASEPAAPDAPPASPPKRTKPEPPPEALQLADLLATRISERQPDNREIQPGRWESTRRRWADAFRLAHQQDGRSWQRLREVLEWSQRDSFWAGNILSAAKLREKFDALAGQMAKAGAGPKPAPRPYVPGGGLRDLAAERRQANGEPR